MKKYCVYIHRRKDNNLPFYIGCCSWHEKRRATGLKKFTRAFASAHRRPRWFKIRNEAGGVTVEIPFVFDDKKDAYKKEYEIVELYGRECFNNGLLTNECRGGIGAPGQYNSAETRKKKSVTKLGELNPMYGKRGKETPMAKMVVNIKTNKVYESVSEAAIDCGFKMKTLYNWLSGHRPNKTDLRFT